MFRNPKSILKSYVIQYSVILFVELVVAYNVITAELITDYEIMMAIIVMIPVFFLICKIFIILFMVIMFQMTLYTQPKRMKDVFFHYRKMILSLYLFPIMIPVILLLKNSVALNSFSFLASFYLLYIYIVIGFNVLLLIRAIFYSNGNDFLGSVGWLTLFTLGIIGSDVPAMLKFGFIVIEMIVLLGLALFLLYYQLAFPLTKQERLEAGSIWQVSVNFQKKNIFQDMLMFHNILSKKQLDTRCDFFQNGRVVLYHTLKEKTFENFIEICQQNYYVIIDVELYNQFVVGNEAAYSNVIIVAIKTDEFVDGRALVPQAFEDVISDCYRLGLSILSGVERLSKRKKRRKGNAI